MKTPSNDMITQVLLMQAAEDGRGPLLFGESYKRALALAPAFAVGDRFPSVYLEHPLIGDPFLDVTLLYNSLPPGTRIASPLAGDHEALMDWFAEACAEANNITFGFELDTEKETPPTAAVHFQPRRELQLVRGFCEAAGEPERADLYLSMDKRMREVWPLSYFGMFRGRASSPLRIAGYINASERLACTDPAHLREVFETVGFTAYDSTMLSQAAKIMELSPGQVDFQFDVYPDGSLGGTFSIEAQFAIERVEAVNASFENGSGARLMQQMESWGIADERWRDSVHVAFARALPVELDDGSLGKFAMINMPQWVKVRWTDCALQPAKLYYLAHAKLL